MISNLSAVRGGKEQKYEMYILVLRMFLRRNRRWNVLNLELF